VDRFHRESRHIFIPARTLIYDINHKLSYLPEWKKHQYTEKYLTVDEEELAKALVFRDLDGQKYVYWKPVYDDERDIERAVRQLAGRANIPLQAPVTEGSWRTWLTDNDSVLAKKAPKDYKDAIAGQVEVCQKVFLRPVSVICGAAGTGKTRVIDAIIKAIDKGHGAGTSFQLLAPTGKAADRIRELTGKQASTVHSFLAKLGWLNPNLTFKPAGGRREDSFQTYIIDEASMLDLELAAALFRAIKWQSVQRLIFVGDPNQLPPIGIGKVFADLIEWMREEQPESIAELKTNIRQMENRVTGQGSGILSLAGLYVHEALGVDNEENKVHAEQLLAKVQKSGDVDKDLHVVYWKDPDHLAKVLEARFIADVEKDSGRKFDRDKPYQAWGEACEDDEGRQRPEYLQVVSPYRGELLGTDHLNTVLQKLLQPYARKAAGESQRSLNGIMVFDKVIQTRNRHKSDLAWAYNCETRKTERIELFNGELGFVKLHGFDKGKLNEPKFRLERFQVVFARKEKMWVNFLYKEEVEENLELAYAISVHKAQGSEFERVYFIVPKHKAALLSPELFYTGLTRAKRHCTLFVEEDISPLLSMRRKEKSHLLGINSSLFEFRPLADALLNMQGWYEEGKLHQALAGLMVRSKSEVIIANMLSERDISFKYEIPLTAPDGTFYLPDFTITWNGERWYWEHWGLMQKEEYRNHRDTKKRWYEKFFPGRLVESSESPTLSADADALIKKFFS
jgi:exodeoxyribonuclease V alpha subunit